MDVNTSKEAGIFSKIYGDDDAVCKERLLRARARLSTSLAGVVVLPSPLHLFRPQLCSLYSIICTSHRRCFQTGPTEPWRLQRWTIAA